MLKCLISSVMVSKDLKCGAAVGLGSRDSCVLLADNSEFGKFHSMTHVYSTSAEQGLLLRAAPDFKKPSTTTQNSQGQTRNKVNARLTV